MLYLCGELPVVTRKYEPLLAAAAQATRDRVAADEERVSARLKPLLRHFNTHLFESELHIGRWLAAHEEEDRLLTSRFDAELGQGPAEYLRDCRLEVAARLLRDTELTVGVIAGLVGYSSRPSFSGSFQHWWGLRPTEFREGIRRTEEALGKTPDRFLSTPFLRDAFSGRLPPEQVKELYDRLLAILRAKMVPQLPPEQDEWTDASPYDDYEQALAENIWEALQHRPFDEQLHLVRRQIGFETSALFDFLRQKSLEEGRADRDRGVELAELALASLDCTPRGQDRDQQIRARLLLSTARRLALDFRGAEKELFLAETEWAEGTDLRDRSLEADILYNKADLRQFQRRYSEALQLVNQALAIYRAMELPVQVARSLMRRAGIRKDSGDLQPTIPDLQTALSLLTEQEESYLAAVAYSHLATSYLQLGDLTAARETIRMGEQLHRNIEDPLGQLQFRWLTALVEQGEGHLDEAEQQFRQIHTELVALGERGHAAVLSLDLAILCAHQRRTQEALDLAVAAVGVLEEFDIQPSALTALDRLTSALANRAVSLSDLEETRAMLDRLIHDSPTRKAPTRCEME